MASGQCLISTRVFQKVTTPTILLLQTKLHPGFISINFIHLNITSRLEILEAYASKRKLNTEGGLQSWKQDYKKEHQVVNLRRLTPESLPIKPVFSLPFFKTNSQTVHTSLTSNSSEDSHLPLPFPDEPGFSLSSFSTSEYSVTGAGTNSR